MHSAGAVCHLQWRSDEPITHVVSRMQSNTFHKAIQRGVHAVNEEWLKQSAARWRRQAEEAYPVPVEPPAAHFSTPYLAYDDRTTWDVCSVYACAVHCALRCELRRAV
eukprot:scaffold2703_cov129-Isochrysis_galbana.AAC.10